MTDLGKHILIIATLIFIFKLTTCFKVYDKMDTKKYCPKNKCKPPTSHLVCSNLKHKEELICLKFKDLGLNETLAKELVTNLNKFRGVLAMGKGIGINGTLPRAYGMKRVEWDSELAAMSKYMLEKGQANRPGPCAKTKKFRSPTYHSVWRENRTELEDIVDAEYEWLLKNLEDVNATVINEPLFDNIGPLRVLRFLYSQVTHIGCCIASCNHHDKTKKIKTYRTYCLLSHKYPLLKPLYSTTPPEYGSHLSPICGCPAGYWESDDCLCEAVIPLTTSTAAYYYTRDRFDEFPAHIETTPDYLDQHSKQPLEIRQWWATPVLREDTKYRAETIEYKLQTPTTKRRPKIVLLPVFAVTRYNRNATPPHRRFNNVSSTSLTKSIHVINFFKDYEVMFANVIDKKASMYTTTESEKEFHGTKLEFNSLDLTTKTFNEKMIDHAILLRRHLNPSYYSAIINGDDKNKDTGGNIMSSLDILEQQKGNFEHRINKINLFKVKKETIQKETLDNELNRKTQFSKTRVSTIDVEKDFEELKNYLTYKTNHVYRDKDNAMNYQQYEPDTISLK